MRSTPKLVLLLLLMLVCFRSNGQWLKKSGSSDDLYKEAKKEIDLKHYQKAINLCHEAIEISPTNLDIHLLLGRAYGLAGKVDSARTELNYVISKNPRYKDAYVYLVNIEAVACNYLQALEYADMGLKYYPNDRDLLLKKLDIYGKEGDWIESSKLADYLFERYSTDSYIRSVYLDYKLTLARQYAHRGYLEISKRAYEAVLEQDPLNKEALQAVFSLDVKSGDYESSLSYTNRALQSSPNSYEFLMKKVSILEEMSRYVEACAVAEKLLKLFPGNPEVQKLVVYMHMEAGRYYMNTDPYLQFQSVLDRDPGNVDALNYLINIAFSRGLLTDALQWVNIALKRTPNNQELILKKMGILESLKRYDQASQLAERVYKNNPTPANRQSFLDLTTLAAKQFISQNDFDSAVISLNSVLFYDHANMAAINYLISAYTQQKRYDEALHTIDEALTYYPGDEQLLFKKAGTLEAYQHYAEASIITKELVSKYPDSRQYLVSFVEQSLAASRQSMQYDDYYGTVSILQDVLDKQPDNLDALNYMINIQAANKHFDSAIYYSDQALNYYPNDKDLLLKKSSIYADAHDYVAATDISGGLYADYPYNIRYRNAYKDQLAAAGQQYLIGNDQDSALIEFNRALEVAPNDTLPLFYTISLLITRGDYDQAQVLIQRGRNLYPNTPFFLLKRAQIYEFQRNWEDAWHSADTLVKLTPYDLGNIEYSEFLYSHFLKNEVGFIYVHTKIIDTLTSSVYGFAAVQYSRKYSRGTITGRVDYAGRVTGTGFMFEGETYYNINRKWYAYGLAGWSPDGKIFPTDRFGLSLYHSFNHGWDGEIGGRYLKADSGIIASPVASVSKEMKEFYFNLRGYYIYLVGNTYLDGLPTNPQQQGKSYFASILTTRFYVENRASFFSAIMGYGTAPDDFSRNYQIVSLSQYPSVSAGMGFSKQFHYRTTVSLFATWYNTKIYPTVYRNQYDVAITVTHRF